MFPLPSKMNLLLWGVLALCATGLVIVVNKWRLDSNALKHERVEFKRQLASYESKLATERENRRKADEADTRLSTKQDALADERRAAPLPAVRVCRNARANVPEAPAVAAETPQADDARADAQDRDAADIIDIGPPLDDFATDAESNLNQCEELIRFNLENSAP